MTSDQLYSTRSVGMNLARRLNARIRLLARSRPVATIEIQRLFQVSLRDAEHLVDLPGLEESVSKLTSRRYGPRRVASRLNLAGLFKARKDVCKISLVALATPELLLFSRR